MESEHSCTKIDKLDNSNYHYWKIRIEHLLILKDWKISSMTILLVPTLQLLLKLHYGERKTRRLKLSLALVSRTNCLKM